MIVLFIFLFHHWLYIINNTFSSNVASSRRFGPSYAGWRRRPRSPPNWVLSVYVASPVNVYMDFFYFLFIVERFEFVHWWNGFYTIYI